MPFNVSFTNLNILFVHTCIFLSSQSFMFRRVVIWVFVETQPNNHKNYRRDEIRRGGEIGGRNRNKGREERKRENRERGERIRERIGLNNVIQCIKLL